MKEKSLKDILSDSWYDTPEKIEKTITQLQNKVSYGLPLLLKPLYDIKFPDNPFLRYMEAGAFKPVTRRLIEYNIPRETALFLENEYASDLDVNDCSFDHKLKKILTENYPFLNYWVQIQLEGLLSKPEHYF